MSAPTKPLLRNVDEIRAAGAEAVKSWPPPSDAKVNAIVALLSSSRAPRKTANAA